MLIGRFGEDKSLVGICDLFDNDVCVVFEDFSIMVLGIFGG